MSSTDKRTTIFPGANVNPFGKRPAENGPDKPSRLSASQLPKVPPFLSRERRPHPPAPLPVKANPDSQRFSPPSRVSRGRDNSVQGQGFVCHKGTPWQKYHAIIRDDQAGEVTVAHGQKPNHPIIAVKQQKCKEGNAIKRLCSSSHENIVSLYEAYHEGETVFFVYECMDVSLAEIQSTSHGNLLSFQIAAVCREVLQGVLYIHEQLQILHGSIDTESVMVSRDGSVKIANIGRSMLKGAPSNGNEQHDLRALGLLMFQLMELHTSLQDPNTVELQQPEKWDPEIKKFLSDTAESSGQELQKYLPGKVTRALLPQTTGHNSREVCLKELDGV